MTLKIVVDENIPFAEAFFAPLGDVVRLPGRTMTAADVRDADALVVRSVTPVNAALLAGSSIKFVGTCTIGTDHLDLDYLQANNIGFSSAPGCNANSVVEYIFSALCALNIDWRSMNIGIVGCGNVGGHLYRRLREFGVSCRCYDPLLSSDKNSDLTTLAEVLGCDIVCLHTPLTQTGPHPSFHLLGEAELNLLKPGSVLINAGRGGVIDNRALLEFLQKKPDVRVVLDVWEGEPNINTELMALVDLASPHIAGYSFDGKVAGTEMIYKALCRHFNLPVAQSAASLMPTEKATLGIPSGESDFAILRELILSAYDVRDDDARMRARLAPLAGQDLAEGFDYLRKNYPERRELSHFQIAALGSSDSERSAEDSLVNTEQSTIEKKPLNSTLATLGFCTGFTNI